MSHPAQSILRWALVSAPGAVQDPPRPAEPELEPTREDSPLERTGRTEPGAARRESFLTRHWQRIALGAVLLLSAALNLIGLDRAGYANQYYAATVLSMLQNWRNFFFASFDPGGFVSVDKPPVGFWVQVASAKLLGFSGLSILLPQALTGVASVAVLYALVGRAFGRPAGLPAALALALTPISVVTSRNNTIDSLLVLVVLLAAWAAFRAAERGVRRWLVAAAALIGLGFAIKMLQAYLVAPAIFLPYLAAAPRARLVRIGHVALAGIVLLAVSLAWPVAVDLTPEDQRPYVGSTQDNSAVSLALGVWGGWRAYRRGHRLGWLLPLALVATGALQARILIDYPDYARWLTPIALGAVVAGAALLMLKLGRRLVRHRPRLALLAPVAAGVGMVALLAAPSVWAGVSVQDGDGGAGDLGAGHLHAGPGGALTDRPGGPEHTRRRPSSTLRLRRVTRRSGHAGPAALRLHRTGLQQTFSFLGVALQLRLGHSHLAWW